MKINMDEVAKLTEEEKFALVGWIGENIAPVKTPNKHHNSYGLKHFFERDTKIYVTNDQFKGIMLELGYEPINPEGTNWYLCISNLKLRPAIIRFYGHA